MKKVFLDHKTNFKQMDSVCYRITKTLGPKVANDFVNCWFIGHVLITFWYERLFGKYSIWENLNKRKLLIFSFYVKLCNVNTKSGAGYIKKEQKSISRFPVPSRTSHIFWLRDLHQILLLILMELINFYSPDIIRIP